MRIMSVIGAAALALMCLAFPAAAAPPNDHLAFDVMAYELAVAPVLDAAALPAADQPELFAPASTSAADEVAACPLTHALVVVDALDGSTAEHVPACSGHRHDPGWRSS